MQLGFCRSLPCGSLSCAYQTGNMACCSAGFLSGCAISGALLITKTEPTKVGRLLLYISTVTASQKGGEDITFLCHSTIAIEQACPAICSRRHGSKRCAPLVNRLHDAGMMCNLDSVRLGSHLSK